MKYFEEIMADMLANVPETFDKREGSVIWDALAPAAYELQEAYREMDLKAANTYARTADRDGLILRAEEFGLSPYPATYAVRQGLFTPSSIEIAIGERFNFEDLNFTVIEKIANGEYKLQCETLGVGGNLGSGLLLPMNYISGLETARIEDVLIYGEDEEETEAFRTRFFEYLTSDARDGNIAQYKQWAGAFPGIGRAKVLPLWNGANTVKVSILDTVNEPATSELVESFQSYLDPGINGLGNGVAPIGAIVTVSTATPKVINVSATISLKDGYEALGDVETDLVNLFRSIAYNKNAVNYMQVGAALLNNESVEFVNNLKINNGTNDITLANEEVPKLGTTTWTVVTNG